MIAQVNDISFYFVCQHKGGKTIVIVTHNNELAKKAEILFDLKSMTVN